MKRFILMTMCLATLCVGATTANAAAAADSGKQAAFLSAPFTKGKQDMPSALRSAIAKAKGQKGSQRMPSALRSAIAKAKGQKGSQRMPSALRSAIAKAKKHLSAKARKRVVSAIEAQARKNDGSPLAPLLERSKGATARQARCVFEWDFCAWSWNGRWYGEYYLGGYYYFNQWYRVFWSDYGYVYGPGCSYLYYNGYQWVYEGYYNIYTC